MRVEDVGWGEILFCSDIFPEFLDVIFVNLLRAGLSPCFQQFSIGSEGVLWKKCGGSVENIGVILGSSIAHLRLIYGDRCG